MEANPITPSRRRSLRILRREIASVATDGKTDYNAAFNDMVMLGHELFALLRVLIELAESVDDRDDVESFSRTLDSIERARRMFVFRHPAMLRIGQCRDMYVMLCARIEQCREILDVVRTLPAETLSTASCAALPDYTPADGEVCTVCCDGGDKAWLKLPCGHVFHRSCATEWLTNRQKTCPLCRQVVT